MSPGAILLIAFFSVVLASVMILGALWGTGLIFKRKRVSSRVFQPSPIVEIDLKSAPNVAQVSITDSVVAMSTSGQFLITKTKGGTLQRVFMKDGSVAPMTANDSNLDATVSDDGSVAYITDIGSVVLNDKVLVIDGFSARKLQWCEDQLWVFAVDRNESGMLFCVYESKVLPTHTVSPIGGSKNIDHFGYQFSINGNYLIASHPMDQTAHIYVRPDAKSPFKELTVFNPHINGSMFPNGVAISECGTYVALGNPTDTVFGKDEAGTVVVYERTEDNTYIPKMQHSGQCEFDGLGTRCEIRGSFLLTSASKSFYHLLSLDGTRQSYFKANCARLLLDSQIAMIQEDNSVCIKAL